MLMNKGEAEEIKVLVPGPSPEEVENLFLDGEHPVFRVGHSCDQPPDAPHFTFQLQRQTHSHCWGPLPPHWGRGHPGNPWRHHLPSPPGREEAACLGQDSLSSLFKPPLNHEIIDRWGLGQVPCSCPCPWEGQHLSRQA